MSHLARGELMVDQNGCVTFANGSISLRTSAGSTDRHVYGQTAAFSDTLLARFARGDGAGGHARDDGHQIVRVDRLPQMCRKAHAERAGGARKSWV